MNSEGKFEEFDAGEDFLLPRKQGQPPLKPVEYKTYLKIGELVFFCFVKNEGHLA